MVELPLVAALEWCVLAFAGGSGVLVGDAVGSPPHGDVTDRGRVGAGDAGRQPSRTPLSRDRIGAHLLRQLHDELVSAAEVIAPVRMSRKAVGDAGQPRERSGKAVEASERLESPVEDRRRVCGVGQRTFADGVRQRTNGIDAGRGVQDQM